MKQAIDLYSGIGGWTLGMKMSGIENIASFEWWNEAIQTHNLNFGTNHHKINIRNIDIKNEFTDIGTINFVVGSPPCTQFSFANKGGNGDIQDGLIDIYKFLEIIEFIKPKYWAMENIPRVAKILDKELSEGTLKRFKPLVKIIQIVDSADYGVPQNRKRMIAGDFPASLFESYKVNIKKNTLGNVISSLGNMTIEDLTYGYKIARTEITELENEADLTLEEERINRDAKTYHPVYNKMLFPDSLDRPSRTVTATCTRVSRESIIIESKNGYRRLNVRERCVLQGFPITYQFYGRTLNSKFKMIGNAVPPILTYYIFQSMLEVPFNKIKPPKFSTYFHEQPTHEAQKSKLGLPLRKYPSKRKFRFSVPNLRYGSGVRFELSNSPKAINNVWSFKFFYGDSKNIKQIPLDLNTKNILLPIINATKSEVFTQNIVIISKEYENLSSSWLQEMWVSSTPNNEVFNFLDFVGKSIKNILDNIDFDGIDENLIENIIKNKNKKLEKNQESLAVGFYLLSCLNIGLFKL